MCHPGGDVDNEEGCTCVESRRNMGTWLCVQLCLTLCDPMCCRLPDSSVHGIFQVRILEWVVISYSRDLPKAEIKHTSLVSPALAGGFFTISSTWKALIGCPYFLSLFKYNVSCYKLSMPRSIHSLGLQKWCHSCSLCIS